MHDDNINIVTNYTFIATRFANYTNKSHFTSLFPLYYLPYDDGSPVPYNFSDSTYKFKYKTNGTEITVGPEDI